MQYGAKGRPEKARVQRKSWPFKGCGGLYSGIPYSSRETFVTISKGRFLATEYQARHYEK